MGSGEVRQAVAACRSHFIAAAVFSLGINLLYLALPLYMLQVYDRVLSSGSVPTLVMLTIACLIALATLAALDIVRARVLVRSGLRLDDRLSGRVLAATIERANDLGGQERGQGIRDLDTFRQVATGTGIHALFDAPWAPIYIAIIFLIHPLLGALALVCAIVLLLLAVLNEYVTRRAVSGGNEAAARNYSAVEASLRNAEVVQALGMLGNLTRRWLAERGPVLALQATASDRSAWITGTIKFARLFMQALVLALGAYLVIERSITAGAMFAAAIILGRALQPVEQLVGAWRQLLAGRDAFARVMRLLQERPQAQSRLSLPRPRGQVAVENLVYLVPGIKRPVLNGIVFALEPGEALGIVGPTAAGKSTLARMIVGVRRPTAGTVRLDGADVAAMNRDEAGRHTGYLPQDIELFSGTVSENIGRFGEASSESVLEAAALAGAHEMILGLAQGYETQIGDGGSHLSGGQRQRVALARAVFGNPSLVVLDEPNANLDGEGEAALGECLKRLKASATTLIVISHRVAVLNGVDKVLQIRQGTVEAFRTRDEFIARLRQAPRMQSVPPGAARGGKSDMQPVKPDHSARGSIVAGGVIMAAFFVGLGGWAAVAPLSSAVIAPAVIKVEGNRKTVQHLEGGIVRELRVKDGDRVDAGQVLLVLDGTQARGTVDLLTKQFVELRAQEARLLSEQGGASSVQFPQVLESGRADPEIARILDAQTMFFNTRRTALQGQIGVMRQRIAQTREQIIGAEGQLDAQRKQLASIRGELTGLQDLFKQGYVPRQRILELERGAAAFDGQVVETAATVLKLRQSIEELNLQITQLQADRMAQVAADLRDVQVRLIDIEPRLHVSRETLRRIEVTAPSSGIVVGLTAFTIGGVLAAGERVMEIVPDHGDLRVEATINVEDQKDVRVGMEAEVHLVAYRQRSSPVVPGRVVDVSADRLTDQRTGVSYYVAQVKVDQQEVLRMKDVRLAPGMPALVVIPTGERTALDYLLRPLTDSFVRALREK